MDPHAVGSARPEAVIGDANAEEAEERPRQAEADQPDLTAVRVPGQDQIALTGGEMPERARVVEEDEPQRTRRARMRDARAFDAGLSIAVGEVHPEDLHRPGLGH